MVKKKSKLRKIMKRKGSGYGAASQRAKVGKQKTPQNPRRAQ